MTLARFARGFGTSGLLLLAGCSADSGAKDTEKTPNAILTYEQFRATAHRERGTGFFIVDGDLTAADETKLRELYDAYVEDVGSARSAAEGSDIGMSRAPLLVNTVNGVDDRWDFVRQLNLVYCVSTAFGANHARVVQAMAEATLAWHLASDITYQYRSDQDATCDANNLNVTFDVNPTSGQVYLARAFFPNNARAMRNILIDAQTFGPIPPFTLAGILRHELGHTLGYRHENIRTANGTPTCESSNWRPLTPFDPASVMLTPACGARLGSDLVLSPSDRAGAATLYGPPADAGLDVVFYYNSYADLQAAFGPNFVTVRNHFLSDGLREGRRGSAHFDAVYYLANNPDLAATLGPTNYRGAYDHWLSAGLAEGRRASNEFDVRFYLQANPDLAAAFGTNYAAALNHWLTYGLFEGRGASPAFDARYYLEQNVDLQFAFGSTNYAAALAHWILFGRAEGRRGRP